MEYEKNNIPNDIPIDFIHTYHDIENIMNIFKDDRFTIRDDAVGAMYVQCLQHILNIIGEPKNRSGNLVTSNHILESKYIDSRIRAKCISAIDNIRKIKGLLSVYDDTPYLQNK